MITFNANRPVRIEDAGGHGVGGNVKTAIGVYTLSAALTLNQVIPMVAVPKGARIVDLVLAADDLDTNGSPTLALDVGDGTLANRFVAAATVGRAGGVTRLDQPGGAAFQYAGADVIAVKVQAAPATGASAGQIKLVVQYTLD
jgi:hypothetical protein